LLEQLDQLDALDVDTPFPFTALSTPVYSLSTNGSAAGGPPSMNIVTFASPVSLAPRVFALGLYRDTLSWANFLDTRTGVLQILRTKHLPLVALLGRSSGAHVDKIAAIKVRVDGNAAGMQCCALALCRRWVQARVLCAGAAADSRHTQDAGFGIAQFFGQNVLADCFGLVELELMGRPTTVGDHDVAICSVGAHMSNRQDAGDVLTTAHLRAAGLMPAMAAAPSSKR